MGNLESEQRNYIDGTFWLSALNRKLKIINQSIGFVSQSQLAKMFDDILNPSGKFENVYDSLKFGNKVRSSLPPLLTHLTLQDRLRFAKLIGELYSPYLSFADYKTEIAPPQNTPVSRSEPEKKDCDKDCSNCGKAKRSKTVDIEDLLSTVKLIREANQPTSMPTYSNLSEYDNTTDDASSDEEKVDKVEKPRSDTPHPNNQAQRTFVSSDTTIALTLLSLRASIQAEKSDNDADDEHSDDDAKQSQETIESRQPPRSASAPTTLYCVFRPIKEEHVVSTAVQQPNETQNHGEVSTPLAPISPDKLSGDEKAERNSTSSENSASEEEWVTVQELNAQEKQAALEAQKKTSWF